MTEEEARAWVVTRFDEAAARRLDRFGALVIEENARQNLIAPSSVATTWSRHLLDSAQLLLLARRTGDWLDVGTGAGFPGMVIALLSERSVTLVEPRARRVEFLTAAVSELGLTNVNVVRGRAETLPPHLFAVISARAVASLEDLLGMTRHLRDASTRLVLPRGRSGAAEIDLARSRWQGVFHVEHSLTDAESLIVIADGVSV
ncbi:16S rRNA (guanine(527)-N(7))-methyltransferase RsmG [Sphingomonas sp. BK069]|uniref:16S rRNA (guanine(527)-N(7))-methyltransferase RsmG n=1 Tax=Sphingomonas sp. BK069 TaxID=2586979 RepID=UPI0016156894|nr:16S rRNA (guanine(527)-N(7))-methyltransferase RsmG [Sphingomonas sp. BK069]MBB3348085.1 16S rRNA (guanine527-N7)-methyltransferase [Sphingomonas sp. BK069]